ncbi:MAG: WYL domain-containing protein [Spirochaetes bacterium]|nr:WYL domain-containing protein [Spirochaetota bacterium]
MGRIERVFFIHDHITKYGQVFKKTILKEFEISERTLDRDIETMRREMHAPIIYYKQIGVYKYTRPYDLLSFHNEKSLITLVFFENIIDCKYYLPVYSNNIKKELLKGFPQKWKKLSTEFIIYENVEFEEINFEILNTILISYLDSKIIKVDYTDANNNRTLREVFAKKLINYGGKWYLIVIDIGKNELRTLLLARINSIVLTDKIYENKDSISDEDLKNLINNSFGIYKGYLTKNAVIKFYKKIANIVEKQNWHKMQVLEKIEENGEKVVKLTVPYTYPDELVGKVLRYGEFAEIVEPEELRKLWLSRIKEMYQKFIKY